MVNIFQKPMIFCVEKCTTPYSVLKMYKTLKNDLDISDSLWSFKIDYFTRRGKNTTKFLHHLMKLCSTKSTMHF